VQLEQYRLVSQSFEKRVLDLQKDLKKKEEEIANLKKTDDNVQHAVNHVKPDG
jgi:chromosome segregation ATPase